MGAAKKNPYRLVATWDVGAVGDEQQEMEEVDCMVVVPAMGSGEGEFDTCHCTERGGGHTADGVEEQGDCCAARSEY